LDCVSLSDIPIAWVRGLTTHGKLYAYDQDGSIAEPSQDVDADEANVQMSSV